MHSPTIAYLLLALLPFALANIVSQISDGQIQEPAEAPAVVAPKIAIAPASAPVAAPPPPTSTSVFTSVFTPVLTLSPSSPPPANVTFPPHHANYEVPHPSASVGQVLAVENGTAPTVPIVPTLPTLISEVPTSVEGSPREAGTTQAASKGGAPKQVAGAGLMAVGMGLVAVAMG